MYNIMYIYSVLGKNRDRNNEIIFLGLRSMLRVLTDMVIRHFILLLINTKFKIENSKIDSQLSFK